MKIKQLVRLILQLSIMMSLLVANTSIAAAGGGKGGDIIGQVSNSTSNILPIPTMEELEKLGIVMPDATQPLPSGGTATATAGLSWSSIKMTATAQDSLSSNTVGTYNLCARVVQLARNGVVQGTHSVPACGNRVAGGSITDTLSKTTLIFGYTWVNTTYHDFVNDSTGYAWHTPNSVTANP